MWIEDEERMNHIVGVATMVVDKLCISFGNFGDITVTDF